MAQPEPASYDLAEHIRQVISENGFCLVKSDELDAQQEYIDTLEAYVEKSNRFYSPLSVYLYVVTSVAIGLIVGVYVGRYT